MWSTGPNASIAGSATRRREGGSLLTGRTEALIYFLCVLPEHVRDPELESDHITVVDGKWAFCAANVRADKHEWLDTGGVTRAEIGRRLAAKRAERS